MIPASIIKERAKGRRIESIFGNFFLARKLVTGSNSIASKTANKKGKRIPFP